MVKAVISDAKLFRNLMSTISILVEEANFNLSPEGLKLRSMDPSHVAMVDLELPNEVFQEYDCPESVTIRLSLDGLVKLLKSAKSGEIVELSYIGETRKMELTVRNEVKKQFRFSTLDIMEEETPTPKITFKSKVKMTSNSFKEVIDDAHAISDSVSLEANPEKFTIVAEGEISAAKFEIDKNSPAIIELVTEENSKASFNLTYLTDMIKAGVSVSELLNLEFSTNMPLRLEFPLPQSGILFYYLAPRIEAE